MKTKAADFVPSVAASRSSQSCSTPRCSWQTVSQEFQPEHVFLSDPECSTEQPAPELLLLLSSARSDLEFIFIHPLLEYSHLFVWSWGLDFRIWLDLYFEFFDRPACFDLFLSPPSTYLSIPVLFWMYSPFQIRGDHLRSVPLFSSFWPPTLTRISVSSLLALAPTKMRG